ncbi:MAG: NAD-dependent epimerase/dehydratase family protein [Vicinamibacteraceae bacterium]|nr:NAD-dependent epimerase/dehydratase family protein [Vicinamibacteraceae bacterium]
MATSRRDVLKLAAAGAVGLGLPPGAKHLAAAAASQTAQPAAAQPAAAPVKPLRILILGGTGFTGPHQVRYALARGHKLTLFNRGRRPQEWPAEVEELTGDRNTGDLKALEGREWDVCIDNPTSLPFWVRDAGQVLKGKVKQYVFISTLSVYAADRDVDADETAATHEYKGADPMKETMESLQKNMELYGPLKARSEREAETWFPGITTIIRPGLIVGPGDQSDRFTYWPLRLERGGEVLAPGDGTDTVQIIDARDLAEWTIRMVEKRVFGTFNATGPDYRLTMEEMLLGIRAATTAGAKLTWVPHPFLEQHKVQAWSHMPVWIPPVPDMIGFSRRLVTRALEQGLTFRPLAVTALDTLAWCKTWPPERREKLRAGLTPEREREVLAAWKAQQE